MSYQLSIITPVYNGAQFIEACINNVIAQNHPEAEHIIVDGGSTDGTVEIIERYAQSYHHIRYISERDNGQSDAMNKGVAMAQAKIIGFLNVDDFYEPEVFTKALKAFEHLPEPSFVVGNCNVLVDNDRLFRVNRPSKLKLADLLLGYQIHSHPANPSAYFYHKSIHDRIGGYEPPIPGDVDFSQDLDFIFRAVQIAHCVYVDDTWGNFRMIPGTKTYEDSKRGTDRKRYEYIVRKFHKNLSLYERMILPFRCFYHYNLLKGFHIFRNDKASHAKRAYRAIRALLNTTSFYQRY